MAISRNQKVATLSRLRETVASQKAVVLLTTRDSKESLNAEKNFELRKKAAEFGIKLEIIKNTLIPLAFADTKDIPELTGQTFLAYKHDWNDTDEVSVPKAMVGIVADGFADSVAVHGSVVSGAYFDSAKTITLSKTPSKLESLSMLAALLQQLGGGKIATLVREVPASLARGVKAVAAQK
jgi:ribosomal protein L10